jgi:Helix-turn-helix domain
MAEHLEGQARFHENDMVTVADAARIAQRSVRTIRRAYLSGRLVAHRDANGRRITIRYGDLRDWLLAEPITPPPEPPSSDIVGRVEVRKRSATPAVTGNLELLAAARQRHARRARVSASARPYRGRTDSTST